MNQPRPQSEADSFFPARCYRHRDRETAVSCTRCDRPICPDCMRPAAVGFQCPECVRNQATARRPTLPYGGRIVERSGVTIVLGVLNVVAYLITAVTSPGGFTHNEGARLYNRLVLAPAYVADTHQYYRFLGAAFLHNGPVHLLVNMFSLAVLGPAMERVFGPVRFLAIYLLAALGGSVAVFLFSDPGTATAGASGAIFGLFGALIVIYRKLGLDLRALLPTILINVYLNIYMTSLSWQGHLGGLIAGGLIAAGFVYAPRTNRWVYQASAVTVLMALFVGLTIWRTVALT